MQHTLEILKVIEGALSNNLTQVTAYSELLASKLEREGDARTAQSIRKKLDSSGTNYSTAGISGRPEPIVPVDKDSRLTLGDV